MSGLAEIGIIDFAKFALLVIAIALLLAACWIDVRRFLIPNWLNASLLAAGVAYALVDFAEFSWFSHLSAFILVFLIGALAFQFRFLGGGDVKLMAVIAFWSGFQLMPGFVMITALAGGLLSAVYLTKAWLLKRNTVGKRNALNDLAAQAIVTAGQVASTGKITGSLPESDLLRQPVPYGVAIAVGGVYVFLNIAMHLEWVVN